MAHFVHQSVSLLSWPPSASSAWHSDLQRCRTFFHAAALLQAIEVGTLNWAEVYESLRLEAAARGLASLSAVMPSCGSNRQGAEGGEEGGGGGGGSRSGGGSTSSSAYSPLRVKRVAVVVVSGFAGEAEIGPQKSRRGCAFVSINSLQSEQSDAVATAEDADGTAEDAEATSEDSNAPQVLVFVLLY